MRLFGNKKAVRPNDENNNDNIDSHHYNKENTLNTSEIMSEEPTTTIPIVDEQHPEDEGSVASAASEVKPWDEGGPSDCGYSESIHSVFMSVGEGVHNLVGAPSEKLVSLQKSIGNWFQELSYTTRDIVRGENSEDLHEDAATAMRTLMAGGEEGTNEAVAVTPEAQWTSRVCCNTLVKSCNTILS